MNKRLRNAAIAALAFAAVSGSHGHAGSLDRLNRLVLDGGYSRVALATEDSAVSLRAMRVAERMTSTDPSGWTRAFYNASDGYTYAGVVNAGCTLSVRVSPAHPHVIEPLRLRCDQ